MPPILTARLLLGIPIAMDAIRDPLASAKAELAPLIRKEEFFVFVFGPALARRATSVAPKCNTSSHDKVIRHAQYLRRRVKEALEAEGFTADYANRLPF